jgi:phage shock protein A
MQSLQSRLAQIKDKVQALIADKATLQVDLNQANTKIIELEAGLAHHKNELEMLKDQNKMIKLAKNLSNDGKDSFDVKIKINQVLKEIDKCIDILNEEQ